MPDFVQEQEKKQKALNVAQELKSAQKSGRQLAGNPFEPVEQRVSATTTTTTTTTTEVNAEILRAHSVSPDAEPSDLVPLQAMPAEKMMKEHRGKRARSRACRKKNQETERRWKEQFGEKDEKIEMGHTDTNMNGTQVLELQFYSRMKSMYFGNMAARMTPKGLQSKYECPDPVGTVWRSHCRKYRKLPKTSPDPTVSPEEYAKRLAKEDTENLVDNYQMALFVEKKIAVKPEYFKYTDLTDVQNTGKCFRVADNVCNVLSKEFSKYLSYLEEQKRKGEPVDPELWGQAEEVRRAWHDDGPGDELKNELREFESRVKDFLLQSKMKVSNLLPAVMQEDMNMESFRLALKTVRQMPDGVYRTLMEKELEQKLRTSAENREEIMKNMVTPTIRSEGSTQEYVRERQQRTDELSRAMERLSALYRSSRGQPGAEDDPNPFLQEIFQLGTSRMKFAKLLTAASMWKSVESKRFEDEEEERLKAKRAAMDPGAPGTQPQ